MDVSKNIIKVREGKRIKQSEVADKLNMERPNYSRIEKRGLKMSLEQLMQIADALEVPFLDLISDDNSNPIVNELRNENEKLREIVTKLEDEKRRFKEVEIESINSFHYYYVNVTFIKFLPLIFKEFQNIVKVSHNESTAIVSNSLPQLFDTLISIDRDTINSSLIYKHWDIETSRITQLMQNDSFLITILKDRTSDVINLKEDVHLFQKEYFFFINNSENRDYQNFRNNAEQLLSSELNED